MLCTRSRAYQTQLEKQPLWQAKLLLHRNIYGDDVSRTQNPEYRELFEESWKLELNNVLSLKIDRICSCSLTAFTSIDLNIARMEVEEKVCMVPAIPNSLSIQLSLDRLKKKSRLGTVCMLEEPFGSDTLVRFINSINTLVYQLFSNKLSEFEIRYLYLWIITIEGACRELLDSLWFEQIAVEVRYLFSDEVNLRSILSLRAVVRNSTEL